MNKPKISILCPTFNHEGFIEYYIESILNQSTKDFELIIVDDCSSDDTVSVIKKFNDERIRFYQHNFNKGINATLNELVSYSTSDIVAFIASDDMLYPNYVGEILKAFDDNPTASVVYPALQAIDEDGKIIKNKIIAGNPNKNRYELLRDSFLGTNEIPSPGMAFKKSAYKEIAPLPAGLLQYSDWDMHNKFLMKYNVKILDKTLIKYRISNASTSSRSLDVINREIMENDLVMESFLSIKDLILFKRIFKEDYASFGEPAVETLPYFLSMIAMTSKYPEKRCWGYKTLINYISKNDNLELLYSLYKIDFKQIKNQIKRCDFRLYDHKGILSLKNKYKKYKYLSISLSIAIAVAIIALVLIAFVWNNLLKL